ncbi:ABC transporter permease [Streptomyces zingiberis]|uniref:ABC transporter permease n=1 Tax=Streptomyces zingiberis TaxID=2053010 RepID=A0ABX1BR28_9ACTN|nr:ABC transporter permease [Streptomyces zingiberis]NJQ00186.1 ABC transporter permease [Streptomyces zingiberis]
MSTPSVTQLPTDSPPTEPAATVAETRPARRLLHVVERFGLVFLLLAITAFFALWPGTSDTFATTANLRNILANESILVIAALAALIPLVAERFDLSVGAIVMVSSITTATVVTQLGLPLPLGVLAGMLTGLVIGLVNGVIIAYFNASSLVITLGMSTLLAGVGSYLAGDTTLLGIPDGLAAFGNQYWLGVARPVWLLVVVALAVAYLLGLTVFGRTLLSIGSNESAARLVGLPVARSVMLAFAVSGALAGLAGVLLLARTGSAAAGVGAGYTLPALAAIFLGSTTIKPGRFTVAGTLVGVFSVAISINGLTLAGADDWVEPFFNGAAVVIAVAVSALLAKRRLGGVR